jgi:two-component system chemotaxis response regulator CheB
MIRVLVVDDSLSFRKSLSFLLEKIPGVTVSGTAGSAEEALDYFKGSSPDVMTLDIEMPGMGGLALAEKVRAIARTRILIVSSFTPHGSTIAVQALLRGAHDILHKPRTSDEEFLFRTEIARKVRALGKSADEERDGVSRVAKHGTVSLPHDRPTIVAIGGSTGGPLAISELLGELKDCRLPPVFIVQHMPPGVLPYFAERLSKTLGMDVGMAFQGEVLSPEKIRLAPAGLQALLVEAGDGLHVRMEEDRSGSLHIPSIDRTFESVAGMAGSRAVGVLLSGLGDDGAKGLKLIRDRKGSTFIQSPESSAVAGMPMAAIAEGASDRIMSPQEIGKSLKFWFGTH